MPLLSLKTSAAIEDGQKTKLLGQLSKIVADDLGKPVQYVMVTIEQADIVHARDASPAAFVDVRSIGGLNADVNATMCGHVCLLLGEELGILPERVYMNFVDVPASSWGTNGGVFGG
ncbi:MAG: hypothetical protein GF418_06575 [Chitinivibrionales bacterium]|nr:hypothetical protein [Chitinivibrionales bacterium]MBD3395275.1 hypothetical protein [Chitinivibrionales bacterium]